MPPRIDWSALAQGSPILSAAPEIVRRSARALEIARSERLFSRGDRPAAIYFVITGEVHLVRASGAGAMIVLQRARAGFIAEASLDQPAYHCDAIAVASAQVLAIPRRSFGTALADERFGRLWMSHLAHELRRLRAQAERLSLNTAEERIIHYLETEGDDGVVVLPRSRKDWAGELGLTHEALYRALARMKQDGRLRLEGVHVGLVVPR